MRLTESVSEALKSIRAHKLRAFFTILGTVVGVTFLIAVMYQGSALACAMFLTGQASNILAVSLAAKLAKVDVTWSGWLVAAIVPGAVSCIVVPWLVHRLLTPEITATPEAAAFARTELAKMGAPGRDEAIALSVFIGVALLWITSGWHRLDVTFVALLGLAGQLSGFLTMNIHDLMLVVLVQGVWLVWTGVLLIRRPAG